MIFLAAFRELLHFEERLDLEVSCSSHDFLSGCSLMCDHGAKQAVSWLKALEWSRAMETDFPLDDAVGWLLLNKWVK